MGPEKGRYGNPSVSRRPFSFRSTAAAPPKRRPLSCGRSRPESSILFRHFFHDVHRVVGGARRAVLGVDVTGPVETTKLFEDERIVDLAGARLEPARVVANLHDL